MPVLELPIIGATIPLALIMMTPTNPSAALARVPLQRQIGPPITGASAPRGRTVWVAKLRRRFHFYAKECCPGWQPPEIANKTGLLSVYDWRASRSNLDARVGLPQPDYQTGIGPNPGCRVANDYPNVTRISEGAFRGGDQPDTPSDIFDPPGFGAINTAELTYMDDGQLDPTHNLNRTFQSLPNDTNSVYVNHAWAVMSVGMVNYDKFDLCPDEPHPNEWRAFFHHYRFPNHRECVV